MEPRNYIAAWAKALEGAVLAERKGEKFSLVRKEGEYVDILGHDSSILQIVLDRGSAPYFHNVYTRVVWSEQNPKERPFAFKRYVYGDRLRLPKYVWRKTDGPPFVVLEFPEAFDLSKPKQAFYDDKNFAPEYLTAEGVEERLEIRNLLGEVATKLRA